MPTCDSYDRHLMCVGISGRERYGSGGTGSQHNAFAFPSETVPCEATYSADESEDGESPVSDD